MFTVWYRSSVCSSGKNIVLLFLFFLYTSLIPATETWFTYRYYDKEKIMKHQKDTIRTVDFSDLNFNESDWCVPKQTVLEMVLDNGEGYVDRLKYKVCLNISDIERFDTLLELRSIFQKREKADKLMADIINRLSDEEENKKKIITNKEFNFTEDIAPCYQYVTKSFSRHCMEIELNPYMRTFRYIFVHSCEVEWLNIFKMEAIFTIGCFFKRRLVDIV